MTDELQRLYIELDEAREKRDDPSTPLRAQKIWAELVVELQIKISEILAAEPKS